ncbi:MAG: class I SAM-dependent methyltransferase [Gammaproteobacteria bacterium]|jgi:ubiquinone/menaquinone biosynthesis C-methylase UbiE|nr:class I SAM-dependent methyltransferase [Gammaproteobacteria bacterium]
MLNIFRNLSRKMGGTARSLRYRGKPEQLVADGYNEMAGSYGEWAVRHARADRDKYTRLLLETLPTGATVLELGCGPGEPTTRLLAERFKVTANDISASCLELARRNAPSAQFVQGDMTALQLPAASFDGVVAYYAFHHVPRERYAKLLMSISGWLRAGGVFMAAFYPYDIDDVITPDWHGATMYWSSFDAEQTRALIRDAGLELVTESFESAVEDGKETTFLWIMARKPH